MTKRELERLLIQAGFAKSHGGNHDLWIKEGVGVVPFPRHRGDIPKGTAIAILKRAGIKAKV